jgi:ribose-phosphate pyrophosphokinase
MNEADKGAVILAIEGADGAPPYRVRWDNGREGVFFPGSDSEVEHLPATAAGPACDFDGLLFALGASHALGEDVANALGVPLAHLEERDFDGGEHKCRPLVNVRGRDAFVILSLDGRGAMSANDKLCRLLFFVGALKQASARSVTAVVPYLCYSRKDRQTKARDPVTTRYVAQLFEAVGTDRLVTVDVHNLAAFQNACRCATDHLEATQLFVEHVRTLGAGQRLTVVSPDIGGVKRASRFRDLLTAAVGEDVELAFTEKYRSRGKISGRDAVLGDVAGRTAVVYDDLISSGGTMLRVANALVEQGATAVHLAATRGLFAEAAAALFAAPSVSSVIVTDSVAPGRLPPQVVGNKLTVLGLGALLAEAIGRIHDGGSLSELLQLEN